MYAADARHPDKTLEEKLQALYTMRGNRPSVDLRIREPYLGLLAGMGNPHLHLPPVIHVAGTNGKGSVVAMLRSIFAAAGYRAHVYTSPHLERFNERIVLAGEEIADGALEALIDEAAALSEGGALTFFEITTAMAFAAFSRSKADICLLETGLGGRLDCTNVVEKPLVTVITRIGRDHMEFLGESPEQIAAEKAGIIKRGVPCILGAQIDSAVETVIAARAKELGCSLVRAGMTGVPPTNLTGPYQNENKAAALACLKAVKGYDISFAAIETGLMNVRWPARLQQIMHKNVPPGWQLWVDGGHNESAAKALAQQAALWQAEDGAPPHLILGMMRRKDPAGFVAPLAHHIQDVTAVAVPDEPSSFSAGELADIVRDCGTAVHEAADLRQAVHDICSRGGRGRILIAGSLYLAGHVLSVYK